MDEKRKLLIAIGAAVASNCQPCLERLHDLAPLSDATEQEMQEAVNIGKTIRDNAASKTGEFAASLFGKQKPGEGIKKSDYRCGCI